MELSLIVICFSLLISTGVFAAFPGFGSGLLILILGCNTYLSRFHPQAILYVLISYLIGASIRFLINKKEQCYDTYAKLNTVFAFGVGFSMFTSIHPANSISNSFILILFLMISCVFENYSRIQKRKFWIIRFFLITSIVNILFVIFQTPWKILIKTLFIEGFSPTFQYIFTQNQDLAGVVGGFNNSFISGLFLLICIPFWFNYISYFNKSSHHIYITNWITYTVLFSIVLCNLLLSSKIILLFTFLFIVIGFLQNRHDLISSRNWGYPISALIVAAAVILFAIVIYFTLFGMTTGMENRLQKHLFSIYSFSQNPLFGVGYHQINHYLDWKQIESIFEDENGYSSIFLLLGECGLVGTVPFIVIIVYVFALYKDFNENLVENKDRVYFSILIALTLSTLFYAVHQHLFFWCLLGLLCGHKKTFHEQPQVTFQTEVKYKINH